MSPRSSGRAIVCGSSRGDPDRGERVARDRSGPRPLRSSSRRCAALGSRGSVRLRAGEVLPLGIARVDVERAGRSVLSPDYDTGQIRAIAGPHAQRFTDEVDSLFFSSDFRVEPASDRMGTRLTGPRIAAREGEILTSGVVAGAVQIPSGGAPIVLLAEHQATGGYPVIATVISADVGLVAQRLPGERLRFTRVDRDFAVAALREGRAVLDAIA